MNENSITKSARGLLLVCMILSLAGTTLTAQTEGASTSKDWDLTTQFGEFQDVALSGIVGDTLYITIAKAYPKGTPERREALPMQDVLTLHRGHAGHIGTGALIGLGIGIVLPAIFTAEWTGVDWGEARSGVVVLGGLAGGTLGFVGGLISSGLSSEYLDLSTMSVAERTKAIQHVILFDKLP